ncbi:MAG: SUMF1/EgtB/PvdO family nonheme iron enzyme [Candidatus Aminicenantes bacterium]|nr:MAG: SUMF1/EgtB/PvdO family nonheme iron enzyme [Candidatus Aminicenantes bacterium]
MNSEREQLSYLDYVLEIGVGKGREYPVAVIKSPAGEARESMHFPFDHLELENRLKDLQIALLRSGGKRRRVNLPEEQAVQDFGRELFEALISKEVRSRYDVSLSEADQQRKGLRLKLRILSPELAALPWEFIFDERYSKYLCLSRKTPVVRYLELPQPIQPLKVTLPLRILGMTACPSDLPSLDVEREKQRIEEAINSLEKKGLVDLTWLPGQNWRELQRAMRHGPWHIFHFIGHGGFDTDTDEGIICLANEEGKQHRLSATQLGRLLADHDPLRFVLLNTCEGARSGGRDIFSSTASILVQSGIPAVIAMQYEVTDRAAIEFARAFYEALTEGLPIDASVAEARKAVSLAINNTLEWGIPVLYMRSPDGILFSLAREPMAAKEPAKTPIPGKEKSPHQDISDSIRVIKSQGNDTADYKSKVTIPRQAEEESNADGREPPYLKKEPVKYETEDSEMILIPGGNFIYGGREDDKEASAWEKPRQTIYLPAFYMDIYPVTNRQYCQFLNEVNPGEEKLQNWISLSGEEGNEKCRINKKKNIYWFEPGYEDYPVIYVSWFGAEAYAQWAGKRLPDEVEWEKAARGTEGRRYPWGNEFNKNLCNSAESGIGHTTPVNAYPQGKSLYGCFDMAGNVWEWCADWFDENNDKTGPGSSLKGPKYGTTRIARGGSWFIDSRNCRASNRTGNSPDYRFHSLGFRLARSV